MQPGMLAHLRKRVAAGDLNNIEVIQGRFGENLLGTDNYDRALLVSVLGEIPNQPEAFQEIYQSLVPGGILSVTEVLPDPHYQSQAAVTQLGESTGFQTKLVQKGWRSFTMNLKKPDKSTSS